MTRSRSKQWTEQWGGEIGQQTLRYEELSYRSQDEHWHNWAHGGSNCVCGEPAWKADTDVGARVPFVAYCTVTYDGGRVDRVLVFVLDEHQGTIKVSEGGRCGG